MPNLKEAAVLVAGQVMDVEIVRNFETKKPDGVRVVIMTGDGFAQVKVDAESNLDLNVQPYDRIAWIVRYGAWARNDNAQTTCRFERSANEDDLDQLNSLLRGTAVAA